MSDHLLRLEGVNLSSFLDDTNDLSTIRGGGLLLLQAVDDVRSMFFPNDADAISTGASSGLFRFKAYDGGEKTRKDVESFLNEDIRYRHATFVIDVEAMKDANDFNRARESVFTKNRLRQMRMPSVAFPSGTSYLICDEDSLRPASAAFRGKTGEHVSVSVGQRREHGLDQKRGDFYRQQLKQLDPQPDLAFLTGKQYANDFATIASNRGHGNLDNKLAVLYLDGNAFGAKQAACKTPDGLTAFDKSVKTLRRQFLYDLLLEVVAETPTGEAIRLETLLWGGDEMMFVVPAWKGWWLLDFFFTKSQDWKAPVDGNEQELHHAAGLVFCHHNAPIARIKHLAKDLAELVKTNLGDDKPNQSGCAYLALESFDSVGLDLERYLNQTLLVRSGLNSAHWMLTPEAVKAWLNAFEQGLGEQLAKRQVHRAAKALTSSGVPAAKLSTLLEEPNPAGEARLNSLSDALPDPGKGLLPLHLALLGDYLVCYQKAN